MNPEGLLKLAAGLLACFACAAPAFAQVTLAVDMDTGIPGIQPLRVASPGDTFAVDLILTVGPGGVSSYGVSAFFDTAELMLTLPVSANASPLPAGMFSLAPPVEAPPHVFTFNGATFGAGPVNTSFVIGTSNFKVQSGGAIDDALADVTLGFYNAGVDGLFDNAGSPVAPVFLDGYVIPVPPSITAWRSVLTHASTPRSIILNGAATGNGLIGPTVEPRIGGIQKIEVDFSSAVTLGNANLITVTGQTTSPAGVLGGVVSYTPPTTASMVSATTMAITFTAGFLPDRTCYIVTIGAGALGQPLSGDNDVMVRALEGDATGSGDVLLSDAILTKTKATLPVASNVRYDMNLDGAITIAGDAQFAKARVNSPARKALCP